MKYRVVKEYFDAPTDPISVSEGEMLKLIKESDPEGDWPNWIFCKGEGKEGWVPKQILNIQGIEAFVAQSYSAREHSLHMGELLIPEYELNGWVWCEKQDAQKKKAWAPLNHLQAC